jgi:hypothetical protein
MAMITAEDLSNLKKLYIGTIQSDTKDTTGYKKKH